MTVGSSILEKLGGTSPREYQNTGHAHTVKGNVNGSAPAEHACDSSHDIDWDSCKNVDKEITGRKENA